MNRTETMQSVVRITTIGYKLIDRKGMNQTTCCMPSAVCVRSTSYEATQNTMESKFFQRQIADDRERLLFCIYFRGARFVSCKDLLLFRNKLTCSWNTSVLLRRFILSANTCFFRCPQKRFRTRCRLALKSRSRSTLKPLEIPMA